MSTFLEQLFSGDRDAVILGASAYFALMGVISLVHMFWLSRWPSVIGELRKEGVEPFGFGGISPDERTYKAMVRYTYSVDGVVYESDRLNAWYVMAPMTSETTAMNEAAIRSDRRIR